ncbi:amidase domain-containing protein [Thermolongibacillus altinsuensis]|uniref:amidase domain-containing protein n=1 Tax=Thermolongibacillus altinsuensis TaxID=575256 RepID=UPI0025543087|nr:amidase domain-containing protein [Thermolongibacillus altinsuensis]
MRKVLQKILHDRVCSFVYDVKKEDWMLERKKQLLKKRDAEIVKCQAKGNIIQKKKIHQQTVVDYVVHYEFFIRQSGWMYVEEEIEMRQALFENGELVKDEVVSANMEMNVPAKNNEREIGEPVRYQYDRLAAVRYAETWWNDYNPAFKKFAVDCTNFISQCLYAGGIPMTGYPNRIKGWWMKNNQWSHSWAVAHSFRWHLSGSRTGIQTIEKKSPDELFLGDVICYDFQGDGRFDHTTIVVAKDRKGMPLVNAHTSNSRMRYWSYEDSTAYTPSIQYKFFHIIDRH